MITQTHIAAKHDRLRQAAVEAASRVTATPVFADINRFGEPSATRMIWQPTTTGMHPSFV